MLFLYLAIKNSTLKKNLIDITSLMIVLFIEL